jgi:tetratricopeptide (TPR) repeat protein
MRVAGPATAIAFFLAWYLNRTGQVDRLEGLGIVLLGLFLGFPLGVVVGLGSRMAGEQLVKTITASGGLPQPESFSYQEALVMRGMPDAAREAYEAHLATHPDDLNARLALARLWREKLGRPDCAEALYLEARRSKPSPEQEFAIGNALIDLYRASGQLGREMAELARFAERFAGTNAGAAAKGALQRLKEHAARTAESSASGPSQSEARPPCRDR